ncbi:transcriptional regulator, AsnC family [Actinobacteria bacterium OK074]|nr:transcriptional regulator, AsnC family [Actinobacteria bacterium OK074]
MIDDVDKKILHGLQCAPRVSFRRLGEVVGVSEQTAARRYHALRRAGGLRVAGVVNRAVYGQAQWVTRIRCRPDRVGPLADALARRSDIAYAHLASGGSEIICVIRAPFETATGPGAGTGGTVAGAGVPQPREEILLRSLPRSASVLDVGIDLMIHPFGEPATAGWTGYGSRLTAEQVRQLIGAPVESGAGAGADADADAGAGGGPGAGDGPLLLPTAADAPLLDALAEDGRVTHTRLAELTGWSKARVARRLDALETAGTLLYEVDLLPERLGHHLSATLWLRVAPANLHRVGEEVAAHPEAAFAGAVSGRHNLLVAVVCRDAEDFYRYLTTRIATVPGIDAYEVSIQFRLLKRAASMIAHGRLVRPGPA